MASTPPSLSPRPPMLLYIDANPLVSWMHPTRSEHREMLQLIRVFGRHVGPLASLEVHTTRWTFTETHSALYDMALKANNIVPPHGKKHRDILPPHQASLQEATELLDRKINELLDIVNLRTDDPDTQVWEIALRLGKECGIYAPDCLHLATAIIQGCSLLITQDIDFLNKIHLAQSGVIAQIMREQFPFLSTHQFEACPVVASRAILRSVYTARAYLASLGYK